MTINHTFFRIIILFLSFVFFTSFNDVNGIWGFFGHRKINRLAVFTLPEELLPLYKKYIGFIEEHAVDPDKRRYATKHEAVRHYIDLDHWGKPPFENLSRDFAHNLSIHSKLFLVDAKGDTSPIKKFFGKDRAYLCHGVDTVVSCTHKQMIAFYSRYVLRQYYEDEIIFESDTVNSFFRSFIKRGTIHIIDTFSQHGIVPYHLEFALKKLTQAFSDKDLNAILRHSADIGHYIGDAHVPLHTSKNYNGQLSDQVGIHAFWESRIPELFSEEEYDFFVGKAEFITNPRTYFWDIVLASHEYVDEVLSIEKELSRSFPADQQWCYDERLGQNIRIQCREYADAYHKAMKGMVEERMTNSIQSLGSAWLTAWLNAGQPDINDILDKNKLNPIEEETIKVDPKIKARDHDN